MTTKKGYIGSGGINAFGNMATKIENNIRDVNIDNSNIKENKEKVKNMFKAFKGKGVAVGEGENNTSNDKIEINNNNRGDFNNVTVSSIDEINSSENRINFDNSKL